MSVCFDKMAVASRRAALKASTRIREFRSDESGVLLKPMIAFLLSMVAVGGIGIDLMRMERDRTILQYTLDRAVLAAADLDQPLPPDVVVQDYLNKANLSEYYQPPIAETGIGYKRVESTIDTTFETQWLDFSGGQDMPLYANSRAEESIDGLEISLVLDVSGETEQCWHYLAQEFVKDIRGEQVDPYPTFREGSQYQQIIDAIRAGDTWTGIAGAQS